jgi:trimeric autotransporter adhesin
MKKTYALMKIFVAVLLLASAEISAQALSGIYTINSGLATSGTNFQTFNDFATAINANGVSGAVTVNVVANTGPYNEQVVFNQITGASAQNRIVINGNNNLITYASSSSAAYHTIGLNGTDYLAINNLQVQGTGTYAYVLLMWGGANYNNFSACTFSCNPNTTTSNNIPVVISGANNTYGSAGNSGSYNTFSDCQMFSGYFCTTMYGPTSAPFNEGNTFIRCKFEDFYVYGIYNYFHQKLIVKDNIVQRPTRTTLSSAYMMYILYSSGSLIDGNRIRKPFEMQQTSGSLCYGILVQQSTTSAPNDQTIIQNNIISDIRSNGTQYGIQSYGNHLTRHNTISLDNTVSTSGTTYGLMLYAPLAGQTNDARNNLVTITRGGSGTKYAVYIGSSNVTVDENNVYIQSAGGTNYHGYNNGSTTGNLAGWQAMGFDINGSSLDPVYANLATNDMHPTNTTLNNTGAALGVLFDADGMVRHATTPDVGALEFLTPMCSGTPSMTVAGPSYSLCPGETAFAQIGNLSSDQGYTYQWQW